MGLFFFLLLKFLIIIFIEYSSWYVRRIIIQPVHVRSPHEKDLRSEQFGSFSGIRWGTGELYSLFCRHKYILLFLYRYLSLRDRIWSVKLQAPLKVVLNSNLRNNPSHCLKPSYPLCHQVYLLLLIMFKIGVLKK